MKRVFLLTSLCFVCVAAACGSDEDGTTPGAGGGSGGKQGTTCADGYPAVGTACALDFETCKSCPPAFACCDVFECQNGTWAKTQSSLSCPAEAGADAESDAASEGGD
jgi:hypothetical protein